MILYLKLALKYLGGRKLRTLLTTLSILLGVMLIFGLNGLMPAINEPFKKMLMTSSNQVDLVISSESGNTFDESTAKKISDVSDIDAISAELSRSVLLPESQALKSTDGKTVNILTVTGIIAQDHDKVKPIVINEGSSLTADVSNELIISEDLSGKTGLKVGDKITLPSAEGVMEFKIVGLYKNQPTFGNDEVYITLPSAQRLFGQTGMINTIELIFKSDADKETVRSAILGTLGSGFKAGGNQGGNEFAAIIDMAQKIFYMFGIVALIMSGFIIFISFRTIVAERKHDIGLLRAVGAPRRKIIMIILSEGIIQGVTGTVLGLLSGYFLVKAMLNMISPIWEKMTHIPFGEPSFSPLTFAIAIILGVGVTIAGGLIPAFSAGKVPALDALRPADIGGSNAISKRRAVTGLILIAISLISVILGYSKAISIGWLLFTIGIIMSGPVMIKPISDLFSKLLRFFYAKEGEVAKGNLENNPRRAAMTAITVMIGLALIVSLSGVISSLKTSMNEYIEKSLGSDYLILPQSLVLAGGNVGIQPELKDQLGMVSGVGATTSLRLSKSKYNNSEFQILGIDPTTYPQVSGLDFSAGNENDAYTKLKEGRNIIVNGIFASSNMVNTGDILELSTPEGIKEYTIVGIGMDFINAKITTGYISQENLLKDFHEQTDIMILIDKSTNADGVALKSKLEGLLKPYTSYKLLSAIEFKDSMVKDIETSISLINILLLAIAIPSLIALINTLGIAVIERTRELGVMRAVGSTRKQLKRIITAESLLLSGIGTLFGLLTGIWLGYVLVDATNTAGFKISYHFPTEGLILCIVAGLVFGLLGAVIPARHAARIKIVEALKFE